jgi:hypothetical protein
MGGLLRVIGENTSLKCLPCDRVNLDYGQFAEYQDAEEHPAQEPFERPRLPASKKAIAEIPVTVPSILKYFLDGSRRTYKIADVVIDKRRYLPMIAGQIGVAVLERTEEELEYKPVRDFCRFRNVLALPDSISPDEVGELEILVNERSPVRFHLLQYRDKRDDPSRDPVDLGVARIMSEMHDIEIEAVRQMEARDFLADHYGMLVIDGPLRFKKKFDLVQFRNVVGLSKSFRPTFMVGTRRKRVDVGSIACGLRYAERTSVFRTAHEDKTIGMWYLRIRPPHHMSNPLEGVVKIERYAVDPADREEGFEGSRIDNISRHVLRERNVTPYQSDVRWASHIYPVYAAERYLKSSFLSDMQFKAIF